MTKKARSRSRSKRVKTIGLHTSTPNHKFGLIPVNNLTWGNPNAEQKLQIENEGSYDYIANQFMDVPYQNNDGDYASTELKQVQTSMQKLAEEKIVRMCISFDEDLNGMMKDVAEKCGVVRSKEFVNELNKDLGSIIMKLKFYYNRIRPFQLANIYAFPLNPMPSPSAHSPSYPSGHTIQAKVFADVLSLKYPDSQPTLDKFAKQCMTSREILGLHFKSDNLFSLQVCEKIMEDKNFRNKYIKQNNIGESVSEAVRQPQNQLTPEDVFGGMPDEPHPNHNQMNVSGDEVFGGMPQAHNPNPSHLTDADVFGGLPREGGAPFTPKG